MDLLLKKLQQEGGAIDGAVLFGSQLTNPAITSDTDIVLFGGNIKVAHSIECYENKVFDVFRMSLEQAFHHLAVRHPLWLSAFSTGINLSDNKAIDLLLDTAKEIVITQKPILSPDALNKLLFSLDNSYQKLSRSTNSELFYLHYSSHFLNNAKDCLFYARGVYAHNMASQIDLLTTAFGSLSEQIKDFLRHTDIAKKQQLAECIYSHIRQCCPTPVVYPVVISHQ
ncbi:MAG: hypothetical protein A2203_09615 [Chromatiales bacterium RIFOXYA1_FULL_46_5]|nr:MAG: hypothetical protein A2203_09615 [Chromatiales bacterium RIFOXYA1_FULL_46_5]